MKRLLILIIGVTLSSLVWNCSSNSGETEKPTVADPSGLTEIQLVNGIGPITEVKLGPIDQELADKGMQIFDTKCLACHKMSERVVGPPLGDVTKRRTPEFIMNMILNPDEMVKKHPDIKKMLAEYYIPMTFQNVSEEDSRAILEYLRTQAPSE